MDKEQLKEALRLQAEAEKPKKIKRKREPDIFQTVAKRKKDIVARQKTVDNRVEKELLEKKRMKDPVYRETCKRTLEKGDRKFKRRARNLSLRRRLVRKLTNNTYRCPCCKQVKVETSRWVINTAETKIICRQCYSSKGWAGLDNTNIDLTRIELFKEKIHRYKVDPIALCRMRETLKMSVEQFSQAIGWASTYQYQLESGSHPFVSKKTMSEICQVFNKKGFPISREIWGTPKVRFVVHGTLIKNARKLKGISLRSFAAQAGWSHPYQSKLESGSIRTISQEAAEIISNIVN